MTIKTPGTPNETPDPQKDTGSCLPQRHRGQARRVWLTVWEPNEIACIAHEFSHHKLYTENNGEFFAVARLLSGCAEHADCHDAYVETARRYQLHTELYADLGSAFICEGPLVPIASLVKVNTGLKNVTTVADYLVQAEEILAQDKTGAEGYTHPETYIRAKALDDAPKDTSRYLVLVRGKLDVRRLDQA